MENNKYQELVLTPRHKVDEWADIVTKKIEEGAQIAVFFDTETTGGVSGNKINPIEILGVNEGKLHRIIELGAIVTIQNNSTGMYEDLKDSAGDNIRFHEYINPWAEDKSEQRRTNTIDKTPEGFMSAYNVHGIREKFLRGQENLGAACEEINSNFVLPQAAPTFEQIIEPFFKITGLNNIIEDNGIQKNIKFLAHNIEFDNKFMNSEFLLRGLSVFESYCSPVCTLGLVKSIMPKEVVGKYKLDSLYEYTRSIPNTKVENIPRELHGAYIDSKMLYQVVNEILNTDYAINSPNVIFDNSEKTETKKIKEILNNKINAGREIKRKLVTLGR